MIERSRSSFPSSLTFIKLMVFVLLLTSVDGFTQPYRTRNNGFCYTLELMQAIARHDTIYPNPHLPASIEVSLRKKEIRELFQLHADLWHEGLERKKILAIIEQYRSGRIPSAQDIADLKDVRARLKQLRFAFVAFDRSHSAPSAIDDLATTLGHLQDAVKAEKPELVRKEAKSAVDLLTKSKMAKVEKEITDFQPSGKTSFTQWLNEQALEIDESLRAKSLTPKQYHETRKAISRLVAVFDALNTTGPSETTQRTVELLSTLNGKMGGEHDVLVVGKLDGTLDYYEGDVTLAPDVRAMLEEVVERFHE